MAEGQGWKTLVTKGQKIGFKKKITGYSRQKTEKIVRNATIVKIRAVTDV